MEFKLKISSKAVENINQHAIESFPNECCGFLFGEEKGGRFIALAMQVKNSKEGDQRRRFEISPLDYLKAERFALENDTNLLGIYHSHPNHPAIASRHDLEKAMPVFSYLIVSVMDGEIDDIKSWKLKENHKEFAEEKLEIKEFTH